MRVILFPGFSATSTGIGIEQVFNTHLLNKGTSFDDLEL